MINPTKLLEIACHQCYPPAVDLLCRTNGFLSVAEALNDQLQITHLRDHGAIDELAAIELYEALKPQSLTPFLSARRFAILTPEKKIELVQQLLNAKASENDILAEKLIINYGLLNLTKLMLLMQNRSDSVFARIPTEIIQVIDDIYQQKKLWSELIIIANLRGRSTPESIISLLIGRINYVFFEKLHDAFECHC